MLSIKSPNEIAEELASRLKELRLDKAWSRKELSERSGVTLASLKRFELTGQISLERLLQLCFTLGRIDDFDKVLRPNMPMTMKELKSKTKKRKRGKRRT